jgi:hypothetical protein
MRCLYYQGKYTGKTGRGFSIKYKCETFIHFEWKSEWAYKEHSQANRNDNSNSKYCNHITQHRSHVWYSNRCCGCRKERRQRKEHNALDKHNIYEISMDNLQLSNTCSDTHSAIFPTLCELRFAIGTQAERNTKWCSTTAMGGRLVEREIVYTDGCKHDSNSCILQIIAVTKICTTCNSDYKLSRVRSWMITEYITHSRWHEGCKRRMEKEYISNKRQLLFTHQDVVQRYFNLGMWYCSFISSVQ